MTIGSMLVWLAVLVVSTLVVQTVTSIVRGIIRDTVRAPADSARAMGEDPRNPGVLLWHAAVILLGLAGGVLAVRLYWHSLPGGEWGFGGLAYMFSALPVFVIGMALVSATLLYLGRTWASTTRLLVATVTVLVLLLGFYQTMKWATEAEQGKQRQRDLATFGLKLAENRKAMANVPHAPPGVVPEMIEVSRSADAVEVANRSDQTLRVSVALVIPRDIQWERCRLAFEAEPCTAEAESCVSVVGPDGVERPDTTLVRNENPLLAAGQARSFGNACGPRFASAALEFRITDVTDPRDRHREFYSDSAVVPDEPKLWQDPK